MYSKDIEFRDNLFADARGVTGRGLGFKDTDSVRAERNVIVRNATGIFIDNSPTTAGIVNRFADNVVAFNDVGVKLLPAVRSNEFRANRFLSNVVPAAVTGAGDALKNSWTGNYWSEYAGFDQDGDGHGDTPFVYERLSDDLLGKHEELKVFNLGMAAASLDALSRALPLLAPSPILVDSTPILDAGTTASTESTNGRTPVPLAAGLLALSLAVAALVYGLRRPLGRSA
jgi:nitrous oxidase accessory protein